MTSLLTGASGMLGRELVKILPKNILTPSHRELDLSDLESLRKYLDQNNVSEVIHCAAQTELSVQSNPDYEYKLHAGCVGVFNEYVDRVTYISTNPGSMPSPGKGNVYYRTKYMGEWITMERPENLVIRTNIYGNGGLVKWAMSSLYQEKEIGGYSNVFFNPVSTKQLANYITTCSIDTGVINILGSMTLSKYDFLRILADKFNLNKLLIKKNDKMLGDLTIPMQNNYIICNTIDGIQTLEVDYES